MPTKPGCKNFSGPIPEKLKDKIDEQLAVTKLPIGRIIEALAEFWADLSVDEQKMLCYGVNSVTLGNFVFSRVKEYLGSPDGMSLLDEAFAQRAEPILERRAAERHRPSKAR